MSELIKKYFPELTKQQAEQFDSLLPYYTEWNEKINLISRKDMEHFYERHVLHSLAIAKFIQFKDQTHMLDIGTGGGFPGIPLAILFPNVKFHLVDSIGKKIMVVKDVIDRLALTNVTAEQIRAEEHKLNYHFVVCRAVADMKEIYAWVKKNISESQFNDSPNGLICLKGGDVTNEIKMFRDSIKVEDIHTYFDEEFFETKKIIYFPLKTKSNK